MKTDEETKFNIKDLKSTVSLPRDKTINFIAIVIDVGSLIYKENNQVSYTLKITDKSILEHNQNSQNSKKTHCKLIFQKSKDLFEFPSIFRLGDIIMVKRATYSEKETKLINSNPVENIDVQMIISKRSFGFWVFEGCSKSDYIPISKQVYEDFLNYEITDTDKQNIYEVRKTIYEHFCLKDSLTFDQVYMKEIQELQSFKLNYFDLCATVVKKRLLEGNKISLILQDDTGCFELELTGMKFSNVRENDLIIVKNGAFNEKRTKVLSIDEKFNILIIPDCFYLKLKNNKDKDQCELIIRQNNPNDYFHLESRIIKVPNGEDWFKIPRIKLYELCLMKCPNKHIFRTKLMIIRICDDEGIIKFYCSKCNVMFAPGYKKDEICLLCKKEIKIIYDFYLIVKDDTISLLKYKFKVSSYDGNAENFFSGLVNPKHFYENMEKLQYIYKKEKENLLTFNNFIWVVFEINNSSGELEPRIIDY